uniref:Uncharacterized protein n=1 Tax=Arundo donax TaxID=35708 RepID=A0A0A9DRJ5_ARUDO
MIEIDPGNLSGKAHCQQQYIECRRRRGRRTATRSARPRHPPPPATPRCWRARRW